MKHIHSLTISLPEPCSQDWNEMQPGGCGRYCDACQKTVIDFTGMTDEQVIKVFKDETNVCGKFKVGQLGRRITTPKLQSFKMSVTQKMAASLLMATSFVVNTFAQQAAKTTRLTAVDKVSSGVNSFHNYVQGKIVHTSDKTAFAGIMVNAYEPVTNVLLGFGISDDHGFVKIDIGFYPGDKVRLQAAAKNVSMSNLMAAVSKPDLPVSFQHDAYRIPESYRVTGAVAIPQQEYLTTDGVNNEGIVVGGVSVRHSFLWRVIYHAKNLFR